MPTPPNPHPEPHRWPPLTPGQTLRIDAACIADATAEHAPGTLILRKLDPGWEVLFVGPTPPVSESSTSDSLAHLGPFTRFLTLPTSTILPPFVNAHTHLDLTALGPRPHDPAHGFGSWLGMIRAERPTTPDAIRASVNRGIALSLAGGVVAVGDIAGNTGGGGGARLEPFEALAASPLLGVSFVEFFAIGKMEHPAMAAIETLLREHAAQFADSDPAHVRLGLQPHAPYSVSLNAYKRLLDLAPANVPLSMHLAETLAEREFIASATGPQRAFLESLGLWDDALLDTLGHGRSPVEHLRPVLEQRSVTTGEGATKRPPWVLAHVNDASDADIQTLARTNASVVYCPRAHDYFNHTPALGPHRWQDMLKAGVNVCLATDSIINLDTPDRITPLDDARLLYRQSLDGGNPVGPSVLLRMITSNPARALTLDPVGFTFAPGARLLCVVEIEMADSLSQVMAGCPDDGCAIVGR